MGPVELNRESMVSAVSWTLLEGGIKKSDADAWRARDSSLLVGLMEGWSTRQPKQIGCGSWARGNGETKGAVAWRGR